MAEVLNLNNEVVKMRKEIKRARALIIRKLTRQIVQLKKKKGKEAEVERNQRRSARLLEEIHAMKDLKPDNVTKTALMNDLSFEKVCKDPSSTLSERATARIATHPQISKRIKVIKAAVEAFKDERKKAAGGKASKPVKPAPAPKTDAEKCDDSGDKEVDVEEKEKDACDDDDDNGDGDEGEERTVGFSGAKDISSPTKEEPADKTGGDMEVTASKSELKGPSGEAEVLPEEEPRTLIKLQKSPDAAKKLENSNTPSTKDKKTEKSTENRPPQSQSNSREEMKSPKGEMEMEKEEEESDLNSSDEDDDENEYFDDSTEERFYKQSSQSEGSDEEDDFFLGKVSKLKKRKTVPGVEEGAGHRNVGLLSAPKGKAEGLGRGEGQGQQDLKAMKLESVFCTTLSGTRGASAKGGGRPSAVSKAHKFKNELRERVGARKPAPFQNRGGGQDRGPPPSKFQNHKKHLRGGPEMLDRGSAAAKARQQSGKSWGHRGSAGKASDPSQHVQQALHPSWEASKRRKEQQAQISAFQGKKIKFDD